MLLSLLVGFSVIIPYVGAAVVTVPVLLVAWFQWGWTPTFIWLAVAYFIIQALDGNVLVPSAVLRGGESASGGDHRGDSGLRRDLGLLGGLLRDSARDPGPSHPDGVADPARGFGRRARLTHAPAARLAHPIHPIGSTPAHHARLRPQSLPVLVRRLLPDRVGEPAWIEDLFIRYQAEPRAIQARGELAADEQTTIAIFESVSPSVVYITTSGRVMDLLSRNLLEVPRGTGSGFMWDRHGHVVTNYHVVADVQAAYVRLSNQRVYEAALVGVSPEHDIAVLRIDTAPAVRNPWRSARVTI
jgi:hypothetical protein